MKQQSKCIYKITNNINGKIYIGQTIHPDRRWKEHQRMAKTHYDDFPIHLAIAKYGVENFSFEILEKDVINYDEREKELIKQYNSLRPNGYNVAEGGSSYVMYGEDNPKNTVSNKQIQGIIQALQQNKFTDRQIAKLYNTSDKIVADINHGYSHHQDNIQYPIRHKRGRQKLTEEQMIEIKNLLKTTSLSYQQITDKFQVTKQNIYQINIGKSFRREGDEYPIRKIVEEL